MAEYRIVAKLDPQTSSGTQQVRQDLRGIQNEAKATENALNRSFDQAKFDKTIGALTSRIDKLDKGLGNAAATAATTGKSFDATTGAIERMTAAEFRAVGGMEGLAKATGGASQSQTQLDAALRRVLAATDGEAAEQLRLNNILKDAKLLLDAGTISQERYAQVQMAASATGKGLVNSLGAQRVGMQQLGFQLGDVATMYSLGAKPAQIFGSQIGQVTQALMLMGGSPTSMLGRVAGFLGGPWGIAVSVGLIALTPLVGKIFEGNDALGDAIDKLKKDAAATEIDRQAKEAFNSTLDGHILKLRETNKELEQQIKSQQELRGLALEKAQKDTISDTGRVTTLERQLAAAQTLQTKRQGSFNTSSPGESRVLAGEDLAFARQEVTRLTGELGKARTAAGLAAKEVRLALIPINSAEAEAAADPVKAVTARFQTLRDLYNRTFEAGNMLPDVHKAKLIELSKAQALAEKTARDLNKTVSDGVAVFRSQAQAIGIAGRELQSAGLKVSENAQFGGVTPGVHKGDAHANGTAIDVNQGAGIVEANVPDIRAKFDAMARRYQARGYKVLWNGHVWPAGGSGPGPAITGTDKHYDHMHLEAPGTIVGKATQASTEEQARREEAEAGRLGKKEATVAEQQHNFVQAIVDQSDTRGRPAQEAVFDTVRKAAADYKRQWNEEMSQGDLLTIWQALSDAKAREEAKHFDEAYVLPLKRLQDLQGKTGLDRQVLNAQLDETLRLGQELTPVQAQQIENGIRNGDQLSRQAQILEQVKEPLDSYRATIGALNKMLAKGSINQETFNSRISELNAPAGQFLAGLPGKNADGKQFADVGAQEAAARQRDNDLLKLQTYLDQGTVLERDAAAARAGIWRQYQNTLSEIDGRRLTNASAFFGQLAQLQSSKNREIAAVGKAAAITQATIDAYVAINKALRTIPPPFNIAMAAAIGATALANVASIAGLKEGGYTGDVGKNQIAGMVPVHGQEFVVNAEGTRNNRALLEAINSGRQVRAASSSGRAAGGDSGSGAAAPFVVPAPVVHLRTINVTDPRMVGDYLATPDGEQVFINMLHNNPEIIRQIAGA